MGEFRAVEDLDTVRARNWARHHRPVRRSAGVDTAILEVDKESERRDARVE
jgi:hypothetical protein